ncbi:LamG-like jellyroll fold domain-containing protein [Planctomycetota bacterium]
MKRMIWIIALLWFFVVVQYSKGDLSDNLVAFYPFNGNADDASGNGLNGIVSGPILTEDRFGTENSAYIFDGLDDYIEVPNTGGAFDLTNSWTLAAWVKPYNTGTDQRNDPIIWKIANNGGHQDTFWFGWGYSLTSDNVFSVGLERASDDEDLHIGSLQHNPNQWSHVVCVYDGSNLKMYVDGHLENSSTVGTVVAYTGPAPLRIGNLQHADGHLGSIYRGAFDGIIDDVRIYSRALDETEVLELYKIPLPCLTIEDPNGGEELLAGNNYTVQWNTIGSIDEIQIDYSFDNGLYWWPVAPANIGNTENYTWLVPWISSDQCLVRVSDTNDPNISDTSDDVFTIGPKPPSQYPTLKDILDDPVPPVLESGYDYAELLVPDANYVATLLLESTGDKDENIFGIYNPEDPSEKLELFAGPDSPPDSVIVQFDLMEGTVKNLGTGATANIGPGFGFYLTTYYRPGVISIACHWVTLYTDASLNTNGAENGLIYDASAYKGVITGDPDTVVAFEDTLGLGDRDYDDMVVGITNITPVDSYCTKEIKGDFNGDCRVDGFDFAILAAHWQECNLEPQDYEYEVIDLGTLGGDNSQAWSINNSNQVVGISYLSNGTSQAFIWQNNSITPLGGLPGKSKSEAFDINDNEQIVGIAYELGRNTDQHAVLFDSSGNSNNVDLGTLGGPKSFAHGISNQGQIIGVAKKADNGYYFATRFDPTGGQVNTVIGPPGSRARGINNNDDVVGFALISSACYHAMIFDINGINEGIDLGTLGGGESWAHAINDIDQIVGVASVGSRIYATLFDSTGGEQNKNLGSLGGDFGYTGDISDAVDINNRGQIVGFSITATGGTHATLFDITGNGENINLNDLIDPNTGWILNAANKINDNGWIVGNGINPDGYSHAFLLVPFPEPYCEQYIPGDTNGDCCVNILDLSILCSHWLNCNLFPESACWK